MLTGHHPDDALLMWMESGPVPDSITEGEGGGGQSRREVQREGQGRSRGKGGRERNSGHSTYIQCFSLSHLGREG